MNAIDINEVMDEFGWELETDEEGNIYDIIFVGEKLGSESEIFDTIAPYVQPDSWIEMRGDDGLLWRWVFDGQNCDEICPNPTTVWENE